MNRRKRSDTGILWKCVLFFAMTSLAKGMEADEASTLGQVDVHWDATTDDEGDVMKKSVRFGGAKEFEFFEKFPANVLAQGTAVSIHDPSNDLRSMAMAKIMKKTFRRSGYRNLGQTIIEELEDGNTNNAYDAARKFQARNVNLARIVKNPRYMKMAYCPELKALITALDVDINLAEAYTLLMKLQDHKGIEDVRKAVQELDDAFNQHKTLRVDRSSLLRKAEVTGSEATSKFIPQSGEVHWTVKFMAKSLSTIGEEDLSQLEACLGRIMNDIASMDVTEVQNVDLRRSSVADVREATRPAKDLAAALELPFESVQDRLVESLEKRRSSEKVYYHTGEESLLQAVDEAQKHINLEERRSYEKVYYHKRSNEPNDVDGVPRSGRYLSQAAREAIQVLTADDINALLPSFSDDVRAAFTDLVGSLEAISAPPAHGNLSSAIVYLGTALLIGIVYLYAFVFEVK